MNYSASTDELKNVVALKDLPDEHLNWIIAHSELQEYEDGDVVAKTGEPIDVMWILLEGKVTFYMNVNGRLIYYFSFENNETTGGVGGLLPYSRMKLAPGTSYAVGKVRTIQIHKKHFPELERLNPDFIQKLIGYMTERARSFATMQMQQEKVSALGKLAAGIAHELNNPAAAINRIAAELSKRLKLNFQLTEELLKKNVSPELLNKIRTIVDEKEKEMPLVTRLSPLRRMQKEDEINEWLEANGCSGNHEVAEILTEGGFSTYDLEDIYRHAGDEPLRNVLMWLENLLSSELILKDLGTASDHISMLVGAIKSHVHMDRAGDLHKTNIHKDIDNTLILLEYKLREKKIRVKKEFCKNMPEVQIYIGEMNQVWTNIIDNAIYAMNENGTLIIETFCSTSEVTVRITDDGAGIPKEIISRIFDPFFTTKKVGEGTGIGLDIVYNVLKRHNGDVKVNSVPGRTEFIISFPVSQNEIKEKKKDEASVYNNN